MDTLGMVLDFCSFLMTKVFLVSWIIIPSHDLEILGDPYSTCTSRPINSCFRMFWIVLNSIHFFTDFLSLIMVMIRAISRLVHFMFPVSFLSVPLALSDFNLDRSALSSRSFAPRSSSLNSLKVFSFILPIDLSSFLRFCFLYCIRSILF
jgi:hypothetical protein